MPMPEAKPDAGKVDLSGEIPVSGGEPGDTLGPIAPSRLPCIDAHIHVDLYPEEEQDALLRQAFEHGVEAVIAVSMDLASSVRTRELALRYLGRVHPAYGFHPEQEPPSEGEREELFDWIRERHRAGEAFAIGEVGLPYYKRTEVEAGGGSFDETPYLTLLESFVALAAELDRPIVLHAVYEDADKACELLAIHGVKKAHFHWFKGSTRTLDRMAEAGYSISVTPDIAYEHEIVEVVKRYPLRLIMAETDGPWPFDGPYKGQPTVPAMARESAIGIASVKGLDVSETAETLLRQTRTFYNL
ncbi:TatD family hydrolase [Paenibacillus sp. LHD-117]|uniref:TatD family hydrolase n=1 Tax=Paenibacillus sp. LHD-117 TaxID=3071412 RepID=UPI0027E1A307|nr:TatD family hydrolase [Paenibacillus sp. LHD-117]MDQ6420800.1 TatD family hydrolase [Paenibacillus sp. LHD-117]